MAFPNNRRKLGLLGPGSYGTVCYMLGPYNSQDLELAAHVKGIKSGLITLSECATLTCIHKCGKDTGIVKFQLGVQIDVTISPYLV